MRSSTQGHDDTAVFHPVTNANIVFSCPLSNHFLAFHMSIHLLEMFSPLKLLEWQIVVRKYTLESDRKYGKAKEMTYDQVWEPIS